VHTQRRVVPLIMGGPSTSAGAVKADPKLEKYYPVRIAESPVVVREDLRTHLQKAKSGNRKHELKLINRMGQFRRSSAEYLVPDSLLEVWQEAIQFLRANGRCVDFYSCDPRYWVGAREGGPRWWLPNSR